MYVAMVETHLLETRRNVALHTPKPYKVLALETLWHYSSILCPNAVGEENFLAKRSQVFSGGFVWRKRPREMRARAISNLVSRRAMTTPPSPSILTLLTETRNSECSKRVPLDPCFVRDPNDFELRFKDSIFRPVAIRSPCK